MTTWDPKHEAMRLWGADPCGGAVGSAREGSTQFFRDVDADRYGSYAPWLPGAAGFDRFAGRRLLEIGCGMGTDLARFAGSGADVHAIDLTPRHLSIARQRLLNDGHAVKLVRSDAETLPFADASFDVVYSFGVIHHTPGIRQAVEEIHRVVRPGGRAIVAVYHRNSLFYLAWLARALSNGALFTKGYRRVLADVEQHPHSDAEPLVGVYTRRSARRLFSRFRRVSITAHHAAYAAPVSTIARAAGLAEERRQTLERALSRLGWYLMIDAER
jgi:ubiquinone/menaquinone biosynthesis C-methylase UbiE